MSDEAVNVYERIDITVAGDRLTARPSEFSFDNDGNPTAAVRYETTCPKCGNLIDFCVDDVWHAADQDHVACSHCGAGKHKQEAEAPKAEPEAEPEAVAEEPEREPEPVKPVAKVVKAPAPSPEIKIKPQGQIVEEPAKAKVGGARVPDRGCPFIDPIAEGDYVPELMVVCPECSKAGGADKPVRHAAPICKPVEVPVQEPAQ